VYTMFFAGMTPIGSLFTGLLASAAGIRPTIAIEAGLCLCSVVVALLFGRVKPAEA